MSKQLKWPGILVSESDRDIMIRIRQHDGVLTSIDMKDLLMLSAALAFKKNLLSSTNHTSNQRLDRPITHPTLMNQRDYEDFRQYIALIFYLTAGKKKLESLNDANAMVKNFVDYAQRGLQYLEVSYINSKTGSDDLMEELIDILKKNKSKSIA